MWDGQIECNDKLKAVVIFGYKRSIHLTKVLESITRSANQADFCFHIFLDGPKPSDIENNFALVLNSAQTFKESHRYCSIFRNPTNLGLANSIISGLNKVFSLHKAAIIIEDDIVVTADFFNVMTNMLEGLETNTRIGSVAGFNDTKFPLINREYFLLSRRHSSWGWATWADRWNHVDWTLLDQKDSFLVDLDKKVRRVSPDLVKFSEMRRMGLIDSWATIFNYDLIDKGLFCVVPRHSLVTNIGLDGSGTHLDLKKDITLDSPMLEVTPFNFRDIQKNLHTSKFYDFKVRWIHSIWNKWHIRALIGFRNRIKSQGVCILFPLKKPKI